MDKRDGFRPDYISEIKAGLNSIEEAGKARIRTEKRDALKFESEKLVAEQEKIARSIKALYVIVYQNPDKATPEILMDFIHRQEFKDADFPAEVNENFDNAIKAYKTKREAVSRFIAESHNDPNRMFEQCFGVAPVGKVEAIPGPMTISFRCFDDRDYIASFIHGVIPESGKDARAQEIEKARNSGGAAFSGVKVSSLAGCIITERVGNNSELVPSFRKREVKISGREKNAWQKFKYPTSQEANLVYVRVPTLGEIELILDRDVKGQVVGVRLHQSDREIGHLQPTESAQKIKISLPGKQYSAEEWVELELAKDSFSIFDHTKDGVSFETVEYAGEKLVVKDKEASRRVRRHEEQHQFNKLFVPRNYTFFDSPYSQFKRLGKYAKEHPEQNPVLLVARKLAQFYRQSYIDGRARDEIIAYIRDGHSPDEVFNILSKSSLYDYKNETMIDPQGKKVSVGEYIADEVGSITPEIISRGDIRFTMFKNSRASEGHIIRFDTNGDWKESDKLLIPPQVSLALEDDYNKKLRRWTGLIKNMERAGYKTDEIVPFLNMLPVSRWHSSVRRLLKSKGQRPIDRYKQSSPARMIFED